VPLAARVPVPPNDPCMSAPDGLPLPQRNWAILTIIVGLAASVLSSAITNIALPVIARDLGVTAARSIWIINAFQIAMVVTLLPFAALGDIFGYARVYRAGLVVFAVASLGCALSESLPVIVGWRVLQGLGAAGILSVNPALVRFTFPRNRLGHGMAMTALVVATSAATGPTIAAAILAVGPWQWLFAINVPLSAIAFVLALRALPKNETLQSSFDIMSALLSGATLALLVIGLDMVGHGDWLPGMGCVVVGLGLGVAFVIRQGLIATPMVPIDIFRQRVFTLSIASSFTSFAATAVAFVALPFLFQDVLHKSQVETGLLMTPWPLALACTAPIAGRLSERYPAGILGGIGLAIMCIGLVALALISAETGPVDITLRMILGGIGFGLFQTPNNRLMMSSVPRERSGSAGGIISTARVMGQTFGAAATGIIFGLTVNHALGPSRALWFGAALAGCAAVVSLTRLVGSK
jgi:DHA2 family multidrug resistance protein-like MFS transporter